MSARQLTIGKLNAAKQATIKKGTGKIAAFKHYIEKVKLFSFAFSKSTTGEPTFLQGDNSERFCRNDASLEVNSGQIGFFLHCLAQDVFHILLTTNTSAIAAVLWQERAADLQHKRHPFDHQPQANCSCE